MWKIKKGGEKVTTSKLPWVAATIIIVVAGVGAWAILSTPVEEVTPSPAGGTITAYAAPGTVFGAAPAESGIENIYIMKGDRKYDNTLAMNSATNIDNILATITASGGTATIAYDTAFDIVIAYSAYGDNTAYNNKENAQMEVKIAGAFAFTLENVADIYEVKFENSGSYGTGTASASADYFRMNVIHDNWVNKTLAAGQTLTLDPVRLYCWG